MRKITITEDNFEKVLTKLQNICNKYKMLMWSSYYYDQNGQPMGELGKETPIKTLYDYKNDKDYHYLSRIFYNVTKHHFREAFEKDPDSYDASYYTKDEYKLLIHMQFNCGAAELLHAGDQIIFYPFGIFKIYRRMFFDYNKFEKSLYVPSYFKGRLTKADREMIIAKWEENEQKMDEEYFERLRDEEWD